MKDDIFVSFKKELPLLQKNISLKYHTTFNIGGRARYFLRVDQKKDLVKSLRLALKYKTPFFVLGQGSNVLISDEGFDGLIIKIENKNHKLKVRKGNIIEVPAGITMKELVAFSIENSLEGLEWAGGLPGTFGGAIRGNAGAFGGETKDSIFKVEALDKSFKLRKLSNKQCRFSYRSSIFKQENWIVLSASVKLKKGNKENLQEISNAHINYRKEKHPLEYPNAGSIFKNVDYKKIPSKFKKLFLDKVKKDPFPIVPSAWFIIGAGLSGKKIGNAQISKKHSNYIVNLGGAKTKDIVALIESVKGEVKKKYGITLEQEIQYLE